MKISDMLNIGKVVEGMLNSVGIETAEQLKEAGTEQAFLKLKAAYPDDCCFHKLMGIESAVQDIKKTEISAERKAQLKNFFDELK